MTEMKITKEQARELRFFCKNVVGTRQEFYKLMDKMNAFKYKLDRMQKTCEAIEKFHGETLTSLYDPSPWDEKVEESENK